MYSTIRSVIVAALVVVAPATSFSQTSRFSISVNSLTTNFNYGKSNSMLQPYKKNFTGLQAGISYQAGVTDAFSIVPELYFAIKGGSLTQNNPLTIGKSTLRLYTLDLPVMARVHINKLYVNAGPYASYALGGRLKTDAFAGNAQTSATMSFNNSTTGLNRWDMGLLAGAGYNFNLKKSVMTLDARYGYGLVNISTGTERFNRMLNISLVVSKKYLRSNEGKSK
jgi:hypothetical protein